MIADDVRIDWVMAAWVTLTTYMLIIPSSVTSAFFCPEIKGTRHNCLGILENKVHQQNCRANHIHSTKNCVKESPSPRDVLLGFFSEEERWKIWFYRCSWLLLNENLFACPSSHLNSVGMVSNDKPWPATFRRCDKVLNDLPPTRGGDCEPSFFSTLVKSICILRWKLLDKNFVLMHDICTILRITDRIDTL